jgi:hypothetical protein
VSVRCDLVGMRRFNRCCKTLAKVRSYWDTGVIYGFIARPEAERLVQARAPGITLIRLSGACACV